jgi:CheY-like chemotaxis protein
VAEDSPDAAEMMSLMLGMKGHDVRVAADGEEAVAIGVAFEPQIAFVDIGMPRMDGFEVARRLREQLGRRVALVALTGWGQDEDRRRSREAGFDHHLTKPPEPDVLDQLIAECMERGRLTSQLSEDTWQPQKACCSFTLDQCMSPDGFCSAGSPLSPQPGPSPQAARTPTPGSGPPPRTIDT